MNKSELINFIASDADITKVDAGKALDAFMKGVLDALDKEERVTLVGFGSWSVLKKAARKGRNPRTQETITIPAKKVVKFTVGSGMKK